MTTLGEVIQKVEDGRYSIKYQDVSYGEVKKFSYRGDEADIEANTKIGLGGINDQYVISEKDDVITVNPKGTGYYFQFTPNKP